MKAEPMKPEPPVTSNERGSRARTASLIARSTRFRQDRSQVVAVLALAVGGGQALEARRVDVAHTKRDLLETRDLQALTTLQHLHELPRLEQAARRAGVEP